ncbi:Crp/Fnr family transcriptional regulator [Salsipaludibacter albus]|uniref:Crp/Fnr family transcriptional regulator n=1 Tax=Salsipaludibacter albus TaxID=2849650 RepID=UPI001EE417CA|nr:Crp/Fnr family transcriptional regulator [Salsipaludibacter albus]MBY5164082.1 Crp/Fnr family transcriptional regulator [Salsipaludibacter albus]
MQTVELCIEANDEQGRARSVLHAVGRPIELDVGRVLYRQGEAADALVLVDDGAVQLSIAVGDGQDLAIARVDRGGVVGLVSAVDGQAHAATATVVDTGRGTAVCRRHLRRLLADDPHVATYLLQCLTANLRRADRRLVQHCSKTTLGRVADLLATLDDDAHGGRIDTTQRELADWVGATRESTARSLGRLRDRGAIATGRGWIEVLDRDRLTEATT